MTQAELDRDLSLCSPFYAEQFRARRKRWAAEDRTLALDDLKFYRAFKADLERDAALNDRDVSALVEKLDWLIANRIQYIQKQVMS